MRKLIIALALIIIAFTVAYFLIPSQFKLSRTFSAKANQNTVIRSLTESQIFARFQKEAGKPVTQSPVYTDKEIQLMFAKTSSDLVNTKIVNDGVQTQTYMQVIPMKNDSSVIRWVADYSISKNPLKRFSDYFAAKKADAVMSDFQKRFQSFITNDELVYGFKVERSQVTDTVLVTTVKEFDHYPSPAEYYAMIDELRTYVANNGSEPTNYPMLNITTLDKKFEARVALPTNKELKGTATISAKRMFPGRILIAQVQGGEKTVQHAYGQMEYFLLEHQLLPPAIAFQSLVTDRSKEPDTSKWVTRLYFPVY